MCTYDYTPYTGCPAGQQHYFIQWMKCHKAVERRRYCPIEKSTEAEVLRKLSPNVLSCPLHGPIAVQQHLLDAVRQEEDNRDRDAERGRSRSRARSGLGGKHSLRVKRRKNVRDSDSEDESSSKEKWEPRKPDYETRLDEVPQEEEQQEEKQAETPTDIQTTPLKRQDSHRRANSVDLRPLRTGSIRQTRSEVSLPLTDKNADGHPSADETESSAASTTKRRSRPRNPPNGVIIGLPSSPDMHRRASVRRTSSEAILRKLEGSEQETQPPVPPLPSSVSTMPEISEQAQSAPEQLPQAKALRRGHRGPRSLRELSVEPPMRRIDENIASDQEETELPPARSMTATPEPSAQPTTTTTRAQDPRRQLSTLQIPTHRPTFLREASPASALSTSPSAGRSVRSMGSISSMATTLNSAVSPASTVNTAFTSFSSSVSPVQEGTETFRRDMMGGIPGAMSSRSTLPGLPEACGSETNLAVVLGRKSGDSGYRSSTGSVLQRPGSGGKEGQEQAQAQGLGISTPTQIQQREQQEQQQQQQVGGSVPTQAGSQTGGKTTARAPPPAPLNLAGLSATSNANAVAAQRNPNGLPPCALPISLFSPSNQRDKEFEAAVKAKDKVSLLQKMGLKKKLSGTFHVHGWGSSKGPEVRA